MGESSIGILIILFNLIFLFFIAGFVVFIVQYKSKKKEYNTKINEITKLHKEELLAIQIEIQNQTMQDIGKEIHDNVGQKLTLSHLYLHQMKINHPKEAENIDYDSTERLIKESLDELRSLSKTLTNDNFNFLSLNDLIRKECSQVENYKKTKISFETNCEELNVNYSSKGLIVRIIQEFIQNSLKHANCTNIKIDLKYSNPFLILHLEDDGKGFNPSKISSNGIGLENMKRRISLIGGSLKINSELNKGTFIEIMLKHHENENSNSR